MKVEKTMTLRTYAVLPEYGSEAEGGYAPP